MKNFDPDQMTAGLKKKFEERMNKQAQPWDNHRKTMAELEELVSFMRKYGITKFEQDSLKIELSSDFEQPAVKDEEVKLTPRQQDDKDLARADLEDYLLIEDPLAYERLKADGGLDDIGNS